MLIQAGRHFLDFAVDGLYLQDKTLGEMLRAIKSLGQFDAHLFAELAHGFFDIGENIRQSPHFAIGIRNRNAKLFQGACRFLGRRGHAPDNGVEARSRHRALDAGVTKLADHGGDILERLPGIGGDRRAVFHRFAQRGD